MSALPKFTARMSESDYLAFERTSEEKHEYIDGETYAMVGASEKHNLISVNVLATLHSQLRGKPCKTYPSDMKVNAPSTGSYMYPDVSVVCGDAQFRDDQSDILLNPTLIIEVLSPSTEAYDRGKKFQRYREIESLQAYALISQETPHIDCFVRQDKNTWILSDADGIDAKIDLVPIDCVLSLVDVYERVDFAGEKENTLDE